MEALLLLQLLLSGLASSSYISKARPDEGAEIEDGRLDQVTLMKKYKYPAEKHEITTDDGYILTVFRIPYGRLCPKEKIKGPIILQHGVLSSSVHWVLAGTRSGLGYILADSCYDVWMPNSRGNSFSQGHTHLSKSSYKFWDFSFHEMGIHDHPAVIDYILEKTGAENVTYIGHSQGTSSFLVFDIRRPEYRKKIRAGFLLAPIAFLGHSQCMFLQLMSRFGGAMKLTMDTIGVYQVMQQNDIIDTITAKTCAAIQPVNNLVCKNLMFMVTGFDASQCNSTLLKIILDAGFYGASTKQLIHYAQLMVSQKFRPFDYGLSNYFTYGHLWPPNYDLSAAKSPMYLYYGKNDYLGDVKDVKILANRLPNVKELHEIPLDKFNHMDFLFAMDVVELVYDHLVERIDSLYM